MSKKRSDQQNLAQIHSLTINELKELYQEMLLIRRFEEKAGQLYGMGMIGGFCHLYIGQEAVVVGMQKAITKEDAVITSYRDHGHILAVGVEPKFVMAELMGKAGGCSKGKGGSMHMFDPKKNFFGGHGIVGAQVSIGTGIAFAMKYQNTNNLCLAYYGDGAAHQGQVYESFNMAALWKLPIIFIIENNEYAMGTSVARSTASTELYKRSEPFGIRSRQVDGMNILAVYEAAKEAVDYVRANQGPALLEMKTYRYRGHSMSDPGKYRSKDELTKMKDDRDPIENLKNYLLEQHISIEEFKEIEKTIKQQILAAVEYANDSPQPDPVELYTDVYY